MKLSLDRSVEGSRVVIKSEADHFILSEPKRPLNSNQINWIAGFLEGEGCFYLYRNCPYISATQVQLEPLEKLVRWVGGPFHKRPICRYRKHPIYEWKVTGRKAAGIMMMLYSLLSPKRREKIERVLKVWRKTPSRGMADINKKKATCPQGHPYSEENILFLRKEGMGGKSGRVRLVYD